MFLVLLVPVFVLNGCGSTSGSSATIVTITVAPATASLAVGGTQTFTATARDASNNPVTTTFTWSVEGTIGTVDNSGNFTATTAGTGKVKATVGGVTGEANVTVNPAGPTLTSITVTPNPANLNVGQTQTFTATGNYSDSSTAVITPTWSVTGGIGTIDSSGVFTATTAGTGKVRATSTNNVVGEADVTVEAAFPVGASAAAGYIGSSLMGWTQSTSLLIPRQIVSGFSNTAASRRVTVFENGWWHVIEAGTGLWDINIYYQFWDHSGNNIGNQTSASNVDKMKVYGQYNYIYPNNTGTTYNQTYGNGTDNPVVFEGFSPGETFEINGTLSSSFTADGHDIDLTLTFTDLMLVHNSFYPTSGTVTAVLVYDGSTTYTATVTFDGDNTATVTIPGYGIFQINLDSGSVIS
jgi:hypothetical protein